MDFVARQSFRRSFIHVGAGPKLTAHSYHRNGPRCVVGLAEGVETSESLAFLSARGCDQMQGYCFSRPVSPDAIEAILRAAKAA